MIALSQFRGANRNGFAENCSRSWIEPRAAIGRECAFGDAIAVSGAVARRFSIMMQSSELPAEAATDWWGR
jgi:hypothetical protein